MTIKKSESLGFQGIDSNIENKNNYPLVSIITVVFNGESVLEETILSIANQVYTNIEYIVIDGNSNDQTVKIIKKYDSVINQWISQKDDGIYDAMNLGASMAKGDLIGFLNAGDYLFPHSISEIANGFNANNFDYSMGPVIIEDEKGTFVRVYDPLEKIDLNSNSLTPMPSAHMAIYMKKFFFDSLNGFDLNFKLSSDYDLIIRAMAVSSNVWYFENNLGVFKTGGASGSFKTHFENYKVYKKHSVPFFIRIKGLFFSIFKALVKIFVSKKLILILKSFFNFK